jgi:hypothetical protein
MKTMLKIAVVATALVFMLMADVALLHVPLVPKAHAILGTRRRTAVVAYSAGEAAASKQQAPTAQQQQPAAAPPPAPPPAAAGTPLPLGTVVQALPAGCTSTPVGGIDYFYCGGNFYRAVFQGNNLVYVTAKP